MTAQLTKPSRRKTTLIEVVSKGKKAKKRFVGIVGGFYLAETRERYYRMRLPVKIYLPAVEEQPEQVYFEGGMDVDVFYVQRGDKLNKNIDGGRTLEALRERFPRIELERIHHISESLIKRDGKEMVVMTSLKVHVTLASMRRLKLRALLEE